MAEIEKKKPEKQESSQLEKERTAKLQKLRRLKQKLAEMEKQEEILAQQKIIDVKLLAGTEEFEVNDQIKSELTDLESSIAHEVAHSTLEEEEYKLSSILNKLAGVSNETGKVELSKADLASIDDEIHRLEQEIELEQTKAAVVVSIFDQLCEEYTWLKEPAYGFMYSMPDKRKNKKDYESWLDDWSKVLFDYAQMAAKHIIYTKELLSEKPWSEFKDRTNVIQELADGLIKQKVAEFLDKKKEKLRIYWKSLEFWADSIVDWAKNVAFTEPIFIEDIREANQEFSNLPEEDINRIFNIIAKQGLADKVKIDNKYAIKIIF
ncbi:MAG: hypothetical protein JW776_10860 [Candidatus Lokiarchaeota archaeon]|nr:hypothetical protein [Candidatus Lokiarchaeota archaeon]